ncbi:MAG: sulfate ABC transporter substrate-binding protein, partial [Chloroflexi bacterium]|nr:sulfate ABC transporter substrate-binding protein [Chloroflexota bacterium]
MRIRTVRPKLVTAGLAIVLACGFLLSPMERARAAHLHSGVTLTLVAYSTPTAAYAQIIPAFQETKAGQGVSFTTSYGASGDQAQAVANG